VHNVPLVAVINGRQHLLNDIGCISLTECVLLGDTLKKLSSIAESELMVINEVRIGLTQSRESIVCDLGKIRRALECSGGP